MVGAVVAAAAVVQPVIALAQTRQDESTVAVGSVGVLLAAVRYGNGGAHQRAAIAVGYCAVHHAVATGTATVGVRRWRSGTA